MKKRVYKNFYWLNDDSRTFLSRGYIESEKPAEEWYWDIALNAERILGIDRFAKKFYSYLGRGFYSLSSPVISNFGNDKGLPVSCYNSYIPDNTTGIFDAIGEVGMMSKFGGGTSGYFGDVRPRGSNIGGIEGFYSDGPVRFMELFDKTADVISQGSQRRGSFAAYLPVEHPDIMEFLQIREDGHPIQDMSIGVTITDEWMESMVSGDKERRKVWARIIRKRFETGYPYIFFTDTVNNNAPQVYKDLGRKVLGSNLCSEITLSSNEDESFVCVLSSINLLHWDEIVNTDAIETLIYFLDAVNEEFIQKTEGLRYMERAHNFAKNQRALGMGVLGWHSLLQSKMIPFESMEAKILNNTIFKTIRDRADKATCELAKTLGEPVLLKERGRRNVCTIAIAPTTSSSFILGQVSQGIEPLMSNYFIDRNAKGNFTYKNPYLEELLDEKGKNTPEIWKDILLKNGSVQHLSFLTQEEKGVFKTFDELSQKEIVIQAANRQRYIDQSQSLNLKIPNDANPKEVSDLLIEGWRMGIKTFYYQRGFNSSQELARSINSCVSCEG